MNRIHMKREQITNREWLGTLPASKVYDVIYWLFFRYGRGSTDTRMAIIDWLDEEYTGDPTTDTSRLTV